MENKVFKSDEFRKRLYLSEFEFFDGDEFITFNIVDINTDRNQITVAVSYKFLYQLHNSVLLLFTSPFVRNATTCS